MLIFCPLIEETGFSNASVASDTTLYKELTVKTTVHWSIIDIKVMVTFLLFYHIT